MINTIDTTFNETPETLNGVHMVGSLGVNTLAMLDNAVRVTEFMNVVIGCELIGMDGVFSGTGNIIPDERHAAVPGSQT